MKILLAAFLLLVGSNLWAQPFFYFTSSPANDEYYVPGDTITAIFTIMEDGELGPMRVTTKSDTMKAISELKPVLTLTDYYPPVREYQIAIIVPKDFSSNDSVFVFEVTATKYGTHTLEFRLQGPPASVSSSDELVESSLIIFPNPAQRLVTVVSSGLPKYAKLSIISSDGKPAAEFNNVSDRSNQIDISFLARGEYLVFLSCPSGSSSGKLLVR